MIEYRRVFAIFPEHIEDEQRLIWLKYYYQRWYDNGWYPTQQLHSITSEEYLVRKLGGRL